MGKNTGLQAAPKWALQNSSQELFILGNARGIKSTKFGKGVRTSKKTRCPGIAPLGYSGNCMVSKIPRELSKMNSSHQKLLYLMYLTPWLALPPSSKFSLQGFDVYDRQGPCTVNLELGICFSSNVQSLGPWLAHILCAFWSVFKSEAQKMPFQAWPTFTTQIERGGCV